MELTDFAQAFVYGTGMGGELVRDLLDRLNKNTPGWIDDSPNRPKEKMGDPVLSFDDFLNEYGTGFPVVLAFGNLSSRYNRMWGLRELGIEMPPLISPSAIIHEGVPIHEAILVKDGACVGVGCSIGAGTIVDYGAVVTHHAVVTECSHVGPGAVLCGGARVDARSFIGGNSVVHPLVVVGADCYIESCTVVTENIPDGTYLTRSGRRGRTRGHAAAAANAAGAGD